MYPKIIATANDPLYVWIHTSPTQGVAIDLNTKEVSHSVLYENELNFPEKNGLKEYKDFPVHLFK